MRRALLIVPLLMAGTLAWVVWSGADARVAAWAAGWQREFQTSLAGALRSLRGGKPGATLSLLAICFAYGFFHAVGPGHGKVLIGGYGVARRVTLWRLGAIALLSSLGQAVTAILLVLVGLLLIGWTRQQLTSTAEALMMPASTAAIGLVGLWLALRGGRRLWQVWRTAGGERATEAHGQVHAHDHHPPGHHHHHDHPHGDEVCPSCGHRHAPSLEEVAQTSGWRDTLALVLGVAIRPCSGAILLLVLTAYMDILPIGIAGTIAMAMGTAALTVSVAVASVLARESTLQSLRGAASAARILPLVELAAGVGICLVSAEMLARML